MPCRLKTAAAVISTILMSSSVLRCSTYCWFREIDERGTILSSGPRWVLSGAAFNRHSYLNVVGNGSAPLLSRQAVLECGGYDPSLRAQKAQGCEDLMLQLLVAQRYPIEAVPEHLVGYRQHQSNMSGDRDEILRSWRLVYERLSITQPAVQRRVLRWMEGHCSFGLAEQAMVRGQYGVAIAQLARAMRLDPLRCGSIGLYRLLRSLRHRIGGRRPPPRPVHFYDADPAAVITNDPDAIERGVELLDRLEMRRLARLGALDRRTSPPAPTRAGS